MSGVVYDVVYNVSLLDDIHNYFPALLYSHSRFTSLTQILHYVRHQMNRHFPGYGIGAPTAASGAATTTLNLIQAIDVITLLNRFGGAGAAAGAATTFASAVIVAPTAEQLESASETITDLSGSDLSNRCAICQDGILSTDTCRRLRACGHVYHRSCIDQWYQRSVRCPTCRHDIRDPRPAAGSPVLAAVAAQPQTHETVAPLELPPPL